ncbi:Receptor-like protein kinase FERONIA [Hordeum vulgare]|uniref:non-specific serine/threonine protein kinase n=1 Tax=Hordeum vulgare subsp. vulgare TaxID=112509 RepID=A0A287MW69_HORVV|nr:receptor-like protein kinase ANXUR1 [Hordeum vulgare subsp. vulgare]KAE8767344.1 Receptor-like protein kinase FERONIA [Hordeum vulgare]
MAAARGRGVLLAVLLAVALALVSVGADIYKPTDSILVDCGSDKEGQDEDGRKWTSDKDSKFLPDGGKSSITATADINDPSLPSSVPYMTARVFPKETAYTFPVSDADRHWVRLHFYPASYHDIPADHFFFSVTTSTGVTLLRNFSVYVTAKALTQGYIVREFSLPPSTTGSLSLKFTPTAMNNASYAFVNGIEILSMPNIFADPAQLVGLGDQTLDASAGNMQTMYRLTAGGSYIPATKDSGLSREWFPDTPYIYGAATGVTYEANDTVPIKYPSPAAEYLAPQSVYDTSRHMGRDGNVNRVNNLTWAFEVDGNFTYLVRLHFCSLMEDKINQVVFSILVNNKTATTTGSADIIAWAKEKNPDSPGKGVPVIRDYAVFTAAAPAGADSVLWVTLRPDLTTTPQFVNAFLNGLEVFKTSDASSNLAGPNPDISKMLAEAEAEADDVEGEFRERASNVGALIGGAAGGAAAFGLVAGLCFVAYQSKKRKELSNSRSHSSSGWLPVYGGGGNSQTSVSKSSGGRSAVTLNPNITAMCRHFSLQEIKSATKGFDESLVIGVGGFGKVYRGVVDGDTKVAIKRSNPSSEQGVLEFQTEIEMLSKLRHKHLVSLIGCCEDNGEMILVYDYMGHGTLREHLYKSGKPPLLWRQRLEILIGAARGLHYLHTGAKYTIIHRDVKTTNILVDDKWVAKVSDFGLSKTGPTVQNQTHVSTMVKGSFGYLDPEYFRRQKLTEKSDVYSFGVVLFEVLCARPALNPSLPREQVSLADHALSCQRRGTLEEIIDPVLEGKVAPDCLKKFAETAEKCLSDQGVDRPSMGDVLWNLEFALQMQDTFDNGGKPPEVDDYSSSFTITPPSMEESLAANAAALSLISEDMDEEDIANSVVFSQLTHPTGR